MLTESEFNEVRLVMSVDEELEIPPELDYIVEACRAVSKDRLEDALSFVKEGLRENSGIAEQIDTSLFIALLRALVVELELRSEAYSGSRRAETEPD